MFQQSAPHGIQVDNTLCQFAFLAVVLLLTCTVFKCLKYSVMFLSVVVRKHLCFKFAYYFILH